MRLIPTSLRKLASDAAMLSAILTFLVTGTLSWSALEPIFSTISQWVASLAGSPVTWDILFLVIRYAMAGYLAYHLSRLVRNQLNAMQDQIHTQWVHNMITHAKTTDMLG